MERGPFNDQMAQAWRLYQDPRYLAPVREPQPVWAQQYGLEMKPAWARKFEPPA
ncbi:MAG: hypothetical protein JJE04_25555 [Acidobacteriia bacterium]|nr:hypothetical protein [Terriglobia bacterium]